MPIYEYQCRNCGNELEVLQKMSDAPLMECPECGLPELKKKVSAVAFRLKGGGWYETDFKTGNKKNIAGSTDSADKAPSGDASSSPSSGGDSKGDGKKSDTKKTDAKKTDGKKSA